MGIRVPNRALKRTQTDHAYDLTPNSNKDPLYATTSLLSMFVYMLRAACLKDMPIWLQWTRRVNAVM